QDCEHFVEFQHIHDHKIECILADEHYGQALGKHLNKVLVNQKSSKKARVSSDSINIEEQESLLRIEREKLNILKNKNNKLERQIMLLENLQKLQNN
ncbi:37688_t:CDS:2, partial [Gigaspora margarita]